MRLTSFFRLNDAHRVFLLEYVFYILFWKSLVYYIIHFLLKASFMIAHYLFFARSQTPFGNAFHDAPRRTVYQYGWIEPIGIVSQLYRNAERCVKAFPNGVWEREKVNSFVFAHPTWLLL